jgi:DNA-directed RNA polymerase subunit RPC12/RpoP
MNMTCPQCGKRMLLNFTTSVVACPGCGYVRPDEISQVGQKMQEVKANQQRPAVQITHRGEITAAARAAFDTGLDQLYQGNLTEAIRHFRRAIDFQTDFVDAHLWIAKTVEDEKAKRDYLGNVLAYSPNHLEAMRMMMVLNGRLTAEEAARTINENNAPKQQEAEEVAAKIKALVCPQCGGHLTLNEQIGRVYCSSCGYSAAKPKGGVAEDLLTMALIERRAKPIKWNVGKRVFQCQQCGAEHTLTAEKLSARCRFCDSQNVIVHDLVNSFEQPNGILPFTLTADEARTLIDKHLQGMKERVNEFIFSGNKVAEISAVEGAYLPFWAFDIDVAMSRSRTNYANVFQELAPEQWLEIMPDTLICAVKSLPVRFVDPMTNYDISKAVPYQPNYLAKYPAQLYTIDFDKASYEARGQAMERVRARYRPQEERTYKDEMGQERKEITRTSGHVQNMTLQLLLLPVWTATLTERDGDVRLALVNGQTGKVSMGLYRKRGEK